MFKSYNFWIRLVAVLVLLLRIVGAEFGFSVDSGLIIDIATAIASVLVVLGVIQVPVEKNVVSSAGDGQSENNNFGGKLMKTFEQIREDILTVKEKIATSLTGEEKVLGEIAFILDGIIESDESEVTEPSEQEREDEDVVQVNGEKDALATEQIERCENIVIETNAQDENVAVAEVVGVAEFEKPCETLSVESDTLNKVDDNQDEPKFDEAKFKSVVRRKIVEMFEKEIDVIMEEVLA